MTRTKLEDYVRHGSGDDPVMCPRCGDHPVEFKPTGGFFSFCFRHLAFLSSHEFTQEQGERMMRQAMEHKP